MASKEQILDKIRTLLTDKFESPEQAFQFFDKDNSGSLNRSEIIEMLRQADISRILGSIVASKMISSLDRDNNNELNWDEFKEVVEDLMK